MRGRRSRRAARRPTAARCRSSPPRCARSASTPSATCSPAASSCIACSPAQPALGAADIAASIDAMAPRRPRVRAPAVDDAASDPRAAARDRQPQHRRPGAPALPQRAHLPRRARRLARVGAGVGRAGALLLDRLRTVGHLPALPGLAARVQRVTTRESQRTDEIARYLLPDLALSFELLRTLNSAQVQGTQIAGNGPVLTLRRVVALIGVNGVREAANSLRAWPGPLDSRGAAALRVTIDRVRLAGHVAQALRPAGYDAEVVYLIAVLQNLGRLLLALSLRRRGRADPPTDAAGRRGPQRRRRRRAGAARARRGARRLRRARRRGRGLRPRRRAPVGSRRRHPAHDPPSAGRRRRCESPTTTASCCACSAAPPTKSSRRSICRPPRCRSALGRIVTRFAKVLRINTPHPPRGGRGSARHAEGRRAGCRRRRAIGRRRLRLSKRSPSPQAGPPTSA